MGQIFKRSLDSVKQNRVLSHFQFAQRFYLTIIYCEQFYESLKHIEKTRQAFIFLKQLTKEEIWRLKDSLNRV